jgi:hypothetical protein
MPRNPEVFRALQRWLADDPAPRHGDDAAPRQSGGA